MTSTFQMLPEWAPQAAVLMAWPHTNTDWAPWLNAIESDYVALASAIATDVTPLILCQDEAHREHIKGLLKNQCKHAPLLIVAPYNDTWCRDYGPITLHNHQGFKLLDFCFNGWGDKYESGLDNDINKRLAEYWAASLESVDFELEGGSIECDGQGTLLTTEHCLLNDNRHSNHSKTDIETQVQNALGLSRTLWLTQGMLIGDDTDSHIDNLARFCNPSTIAYASCDDPEDLHFEPLKAMEAELKTFSQRDGTPYILIPVSIPPTQTDENGKRLPASYINFLILNTHVIVPSFNCEQDAEAVQKLGLCFPNHKIITVPGQNLIKQYGGPHCATMQLPKGTVKFAKE